MTKIVVILAVVAAVGGGGAFLGGAFNSGSANIDLSRGTYKVKRGGLKITLTERGTLKTKNSTIIIAETSAKIEWLIDEGKMVEEGEILVELEKDDVRQRVENYKNQVIRLESELKSAETELLLQETQNKTDIEKADLAFEVAQVMLLKLLEGEIPQEKRKLKLAIEKAESDKRRYQQRVDAYRRLIKDDFVTPDQLEAEELKLKTANNDLETAELNKRVYLQYKMPLDKKQKRAAVVEAERAQVRARKRAEARMASKNAIVRQKNVSLKVNKKQLEKQEKILGKMTLKAPNAGTVLYGDPDNPWQRDNIKVGKQVWNNMSLITLPDPTEMAVLIYVHEADIDKVKIDMPAFVTSETRKDKQYEGKITKVDQVANAGRRWGGDGAKKFKVEVALDGKNLNLKPGTSAEVQVMIDELEDVLIVPLQAVHAKEGKFFCFRRDGSGFERISVKLGKDNNSHVEIVDGVSEGDELLLYDPEAGGVNGNASGSSADGDE